MLKFCILTLSVFLSGLVNAQLRLEIGAKDFSDWEGIEKVKNDVATIKNATTISYRFMDNNRRRPGLMRDFDGDVADFSGYAGISFQVYFKKQTTADLTVSLIVDSLDMEKFFPVSTASAKIAGSGWQTVYLPWDLFDIPVGQRGGALQAMKKVLIKVDSKENSTINIKDIHLKKGEMLALSSYVQGRSAVAGGDITYDVEVGNTTNEKQAVKLQFKTMGWESMKAVIEPSALELNPGEIQKCQITVSLPASLPQGVREKQVLQAIPNGIGSATESITFTSAVAVPTPNIVFTADKWQDVKDKIENYEWAKEALAEYEKAASRWKVPAGREPLAKIEETGEYKSIFTKGEGDRIYECGIAYQLTGKTEYAEKVVKLFRRLIDEEIGYPVTLHGGGDSFVAEGVFFQGVGRSYDMIRDAGLFTPEEEALIEKTFRLYIHRCIEGNQRGGIGNWNIAEITGAIYCALALQDFNLVETLMEMPTGINAQISHGVMGDGWWYECSVGYNLWVAAEFSEIAIALEPWGENLKDKQFPIGTTSHYSLEPDRRRPGLYGMNFDKWGKLETNSIGIKDMWDAVVPFLDYRGVLFAINDAKEDRVTAKPFELAYYMYGDPEFAAVIKRGDKRDLLYGVPELPDVDSEKMKESSYADNIGAVVLRSQTEEREQSEQLQAALHYGTHGGYHGHFDRTNFVSLMRYGRSFYNPEMFWYGYSSYLYKMLVQTSINKNMVVVDQKQQEPKESFKTFFYTGDMMQATAVETKARWSHPPYGGIVYSYNPGYTFERKSEEENRSLFIPQDAPEYGLCTGYTDDEVLQRRLMVMMDDYVVLADYLEAEQEHTYDWLFQIKGFRGLTADKKELVRHDNQMNTDPLGAAQFITDCDWYSTEGTARSKFEMCWGDDCDNEGARMPFSEEGTLKMDVFNAWPKQNEIMIGTAPEAIGVNKRVWYTVAADDQTLLKDSTGAWILGSKNIELDITGTKELVLTTKVSQSRNNTIFWGDAKVQLKDGSEVFIASLPLKYNNMLTSASADLDYYGGPVKIQGELMSRSTPGMPKNTEEEASVTIDLSGLDVVSFSAKLGSDFPLGDESSRRKTLAARTQGKETRYLSVIEPFESESVIKSVTAKSADILMVELTDGRVQEVSFSGFEGDGKNISVSVKEFLNDELVREESTK